MIILVVIVSLILYKFYLEFLVWANQEEILFMIFLTSRNTLVSITILIISFPIICGILHIQRRDYSERKSLQYKISSLYYMLDQAIREYHIPDHIIANSYNQIKKLSPEEFISALKETIKEISEFEKIKHKEKLKIKLASQFIELKQKKEKLKLELSKAEEELRKQEEEERLAYLRAQEYQEQKRLEEIELRKKQIAWRIESEKREYLEKLDTYSNRVFKKEKLSKKAYKALIENGYKQVNEYCLLEKKRISVLVKPFGNHSISHEFLVWSAKRLLKETEGIRKIEEHLTRDADLTFEFKRKDFALEIEKGDLLRKKQQLKEKLDYLNKHYPTRWMFIVSNRDFLRKYGKYGFSTSRNRMSENLRKLLKNAHTQKS
jgi:hypothetical protein